MLDTKGVSSGDTLLKTRNCTHWTDKGAGKAGVYWVLMQKAHDTMSDTLLFGLVWLRTKYGNGEPNAITTAVAVALATLSFPPESS